MNDPTVEPGSASPPPPPPPLPQQPPTGRTPASEAAKKRREGKTGKRAYAVVAVAAVLFVGVVVWIVTRPMPYVTHREILELAMQIEATKNSEQLQRHLDPEVFGSMDPAEVKQLLQWRDDAEITYTFITVADERTQRPRLLFRLTRRHASSDATASILSVIDYQEMVADRRGDQVRVVDLRSVLGGDMWLRTLQAERAAAGEGTAMAALGELLAAKDQTQAVAAFRALPVERRSSHAARIALLGHMDTRDHDGFTALAREVRTWVPENLAPAFRLLYDAQFAAQPIEGQLRHDVRAAIGRIQVRIPDDAWLGAFVRAMTATPAEPK